MKNSMYLLKLGAVAITASAACLLALPTTTVAAATSAKESAKTHDVIQMADGRVLTGTILEETASHFVFRYVDPNINIQTQIRVNKDDVLHVERGAVMEHVEQPQIDAGPDLGVTAERERGLAEGDADDESLPAFYVIPMRGQMGTDIHPEVYARILEDIRKHSPHKVIWVLESSDVDDLVLPQNCCGEGSLLMLDDYRELVRLLHDDLRGIEQVMWVKDAVGLSSVVALSWSEMYMTPNARLYGMRIFHDLIDRISDPEGRAKNREAALAMGNGFIERGGRCLNLGHAMMNPNELLSASWHGREVEWRLDLTGEFIVDSSKCQPAGFRAKTAEDFGVSNGTAETLDDLAMLLGYREYRVIEGDAQRIVNRHVADWRRAFENTLTWYKDYQQHLGWATGDQTLMYLGRAKNDLENIVRAMNRFRAVEIRFMLATGVRKFDLEMEIERMNERIRALRNAERNRGGCNRGGRGGCGSGRGGCGRR